MTLPVGNAIANDVPLWATHQLWGVGTNFSAIYQFFENSCAVIPQLSNPKRKSYALLRTNVTEKLATYALGVSSGVGRIEILKASCNGAGNDCMLETSPT